MRNNIHMFPQQQTEKEKNIIFVTESTTELWLINLDKWVLAVGVCDRPPLPEGCHSPWGHQGEMHL